MAPVRTLGPIVSAHRCSRELLDLLVLPAGGLASLLLWGLVSPLWALAPALGAALIYVAYRSGREVLVREGGLEFCAGYASARTVTWDEVERLYEERQDDGAQSVYALTVETTDGRRLVARDVQDWTALSIAVRGSTRAAIRERLRRRWRTGKPLDFGAVRLDAQGLECDGVRVAWDEVRGVTHKDGVLAIKRAKRKGRKRRKVEVASSDVANVAHCASRIRKQLRRHTAA
ncbi:MAG: DUF6585 family protein [Planctomycetota bacterium]